MIELQFYHCVLPNRLLSISTKMERIPVPLLLWFKLLTIIVISLNGELDLLSGTLIFFSIGWITGRFPKCQKKLTKLTLKPNGLLHMGKLVLFLVILLLWKYLISACSPSPFSFIA
jgi:hypothetical protein